VTRGNGGDAPLDVELATALEVRALVKRFKAARKSLGNLDAEAAATLIAVASDVALILDRKGFVRDVAFGSDELAGTLDARWIGRLWTDTVTTESRSKIEEMLHDVGAAKAPRWRQVNHPVSMGGPDVPILYSVMQIGADGRIVAVGRDLRPIATLQQRLLDVEQSMEREYARLRHAETRYRMLFQISSEAVLIVDATTQKIVEANPAALEQLGSRGRRLIGRSFPEGFEPRGMRAIQGLLAAVRAAGTGDDVQASLAEPKRDFLVSASMFRHDGVAHFLVRLAPVRTEGLSPARKSTSRLLEVIEGSPDGLVITTPEGRILTANRAFLDLAQLATVEQARGEPLDRWLGRPGVDLNVLIANLRQHATVRLFATTLRGEYGANADVEVSAVAVPQGEEPCLGFSVRSVARRTQLDSRPVRGEMPRSVEQLTELVGRVSLKELVRESTEVIERLCIEAALELTGDNRASAADMLGLSRQSLYLKLRRYGLGELGPEHPEKPERPEREHEEI
jgi:transcriptional regulator PpsR